MAKYLEYDKTTGRIISEIVSDEKPQSAGDFALLEIQDGEEINTSLYAVRDGQLVKLYETNEERFERERIRKEYGEQIRKRVQAMMYEAVIAILEDDDKTLQSLKAEYKDLKAYL